MPEHTSKARPFRISPSYPQGNRGSRLTARRARSLGARCCLLRTLQPETGACRCGCAACAAVVAKRGLMSTTGVPSIASSGPTASSRPSIPSTVTSMQAERVRAIRRRVAKTPVSGARHRRHADAPGGRSDPPRAARSRARAGRPRGSPGARPRRRLQDDPRAGRSLAALAWRVLPPQSGERTTPIGFSVVAVVAPPPLASSAAPRASGCPTGSAGSPREAIRRRLCCLGLGFGVSSSAPAAHP